MRAEYIEDLNVDPDRLNGAQVVAHLARRVEDTLAEVKASEAWKVVTDPATPVPLVVNILKEIYLEIVMYQPDAIAAALWAIGQMPRSMPVAWLRRCCTTRRRSSITTRWRFATTRVLAAARSSPARGA